MSASSKATRDLLLAAGVATLLLLRYRAFDLGLPAGGAEFLYHRNELEVPFGAMRGFTEDQLARHAGRLFILGPALALFSVVVAAVRGRRGGPGDEAEAPPFGLDPTLVAKVAAGLSLALTALLAVGVLRGRAIVDDELTYRTQALLFARGRITEDLPAWTAGYEAFTLPTPAGLAGKYLFGEPLVQLPGALLGVPALGHLPMAALALWAFHRALRGAAGSVVAGWATALLALSPMFVFTGAVGLSHTSSLACVAVGGLGLQLSREGRARLGAVVAGTALGFGLAVRIQAVGPFGGVLGLWTLASLVRARRWDGVALLVASGGAWVAAIGAYDAALSGDPFTLPWYLFQPVERFGFGPVWEGGAYVHTPLKALENLGVTLLRFNGWWLGWPASLALFGVWLAVGRPARGAAPWLAAGGALLAFNLFYYSTGVSDTGPVYSFELLLPACALGGAALVAAARRWPDATAAALAVHLLLGTVTFYAEHLARIERLVESVHARAEVVLAAIEPPALLIAHPGTRPNKRGWVAGALPVRFRDPDDPVLVYTQMDDAWCRALIARHPDRACWYLPPNEARPVPCEAKWSVQADDSTGATGAPAP